MDDLKKLAIGINQAEAPTDIDAINFQAGTNDIELAIDKRSTLKSRATEKEFHLDWMLPMTDGESEDLGKTVNGIF